MWASRAADILDQLMGVCMRLFVPILGLLFVSATVQAGSFPVAQIPNTVSIQLKNGDNTVRGMDLVEDGGFKMVRKGVYWSTTEKVRGTYDFTAVDPLVADAEERGLTILMTLYGTNSLYETSSTPGIVTAAGRAGFAKFAAAIAGRYKTKKVIYEIWNEPNLNSFWHGPAPSNQNIMADEYTALVKAVVPEMRKADSTSIIVAGSISALWRDSFRWFDRCIAQGILDTGISGISTHPYGFNWPELAALNGYSEIRKKLDAAGKTNMPLVTSEVGYTTEWIVERSKYSEAQAVEVQGWMMIRQQLVDLMSDVRFSNWYELRSSDSFGLLRTDFNPRPAYDLAKVFMQQLSGYRFVKRVSMASASDYVLVLENSAGRQKIVAWTTGAPAPTKNVSIAVGGSGSTRVVNVEGVARNVAISANGNISLSIDGAPQYVEVPAAVVLKNVALNKAVTVSSGSGAAKLTDGDRTNTNSRWMSAADKVYPQYVEIDLAGTFAVSEVRYHQFSQRTDDFKVEAMVGGVWKQVATGTGNTALSISSKFTAVRATRIRFTVTKGSLYQKVYEVEVMGN